MLAARACKTARHLAVVGDDVLFSQKDRSQKFNSFKQPGFAGGVVCHVASMSSVEGSLCERKSSKHELGALIVFTGWKKINGVNKWGQMNIYLTPFNNQGSEYRITSLEVCHHFSRIRPLTCMA